MQRKGTSTPAQPNAADAEQKNISGDAPLPPQEELNLGEPPLPPREAILADIDRLKMKLESEMRSNNLSIVSYASLRRSLDNIDRKLGNVTNKDIKELQTFDEKIETAKQKKANEQLNSDAAAQPPKEASAVQYEAIPAIPAKPAANTNQYDAMPPLKPNTNPLLSHMQAWDAEKLTPPPGRAFMFSGEGPRIRPELDQKIAAEAEELRQIYTTQYDDPGLLQQKLQEYFMKMCREVVAALGNDRSDYSHSQKINAYNSFASAVKRHLIAGPIPIQAPSINKNINTGGFSDLIDKYCIPPNTTVTAFALEHSIPEVSQTDIIHSQNSIQLVNLVDLLNKMREDYKALGKSTHEKAFDSLITRVEAVDGKNPTAKLENAMKILHSEFNGKQSKLNSMFDLGSKKDPLKFIDAINKDKSGHHYPRMLALAIEQVYQGNAKLRAGAPTYLNTTLTSKVHLGRNDIYDKYIPKISPDDDSKKFKALQGELKNSNLSQAQIYRLFTGMDKMDAKMAKKIWPALKDPLNLSDKLIEKLSTDPKAVTEQVVAHIKRSAEIRNQFAKINVANKATPNQEIDKQCKEVTKLLDEIAKNMAEVNKNIKPAPAAAKQNKR